MRSPPAQAELKQVSRELKQLRAQIAGFGIPAYWIVEPSSDRPELTVFELRPGCYEQAAHVTGAEEYRAALPFPVTIAPPQLVTAR